jgi:uncharacterized protein YndB with AHSA1/START domain
MSTNADSALVVQLQRQINAAADKVWPVCAGRIEEWLGMTLFEHHVGGRILVDAQMDKRYIMFGNVTAYDEQQEVAFTWSELDVSRRELVAWDTLVRITLEARDGGTLVTLRHSGFDHLPEAQRQYETYKTGWESLNDLDKLAAMCEGQ